mgnify:CR=1 FL=1
MSAISGIVGEKLPENSKKTLSEMNGIQVHRGPDTQSILQWETVCFGHCSLGSGKPGLMENKEHTLFITCDGSIYNLRELRKKCCDKGYALENEGEAEVLLCLYKEMGMDLLSLLRGDFAFAIWDKTKNTTFLVRDRFGIKPLFYSFKNGILIFASKLKALIRTGMIDKSIDHEAIYHYLFFTFFHQPQTPLKHVRSLSPGHYIEFNTNTGVFSINQYWDIPFSENRSHNEDYLIENFSNLLDESIKLRMDEKASMAVSLSGGIDSSFIAAKMTHTGYPLKTFTFGFRGEGEEYNEFKYAREVSECINSDHKEYVISSQKIMENHKRMVWHLETPTSGIILPFFLAEAAGENNIDITFRGDGAHSLFESPEEKKFRLLTKLYSFVDLLPYSSKIKLCNKIETFLNRFAMYYRTYNNNLAWILHIHSRYFKAITGKRNMELLFTESERKAMFAEPFWEKDPNVKETGEIVLEIMNQIGTNDVEEQMIYEEYKRFPNQALMYISNVHAGFSIECRQPYWDHKLVEFSQKNLPLSLRSKDGQSKYILKKISRSILPDEIIDRPQHGFYMPIHRWLKNDLKPIVDDVFSEETIQKRGLFDVKTMRGIYNQYYSASRKAVSWRKIWTLVALETWFRLFYDPAEITAPAIKVYN